MCTLSFVEMSIQDSQGRTIGAGPGRTPAVLAVLGLACLLWPLPSASQDATSADSTPAATFRSGALAIQSWPVVTLRVPDAFEYLGSTTFDLYDVSRAETHVFAEAGPDRIVDRLYWFQVEAVRPDSDHRYDYTDLPRRVMIGDRSYRADARHGPGYSLDRVDPEGDTAQVLRLLQRRGYSMPETMIRVRLVTTDETGRRELLILYVESLDARDLSADRLEADPARWDRVAAEAVERAAQGIRAR